MLDRLAGQRFTPQRPLGAQRIPAPGGGAARDPVGRGRDQLADLRQDVPLAAALAARDEDGAALIEYTVLLGILIVAVIATITLVGTWVTGQWTGLQAALPT